jgi:hypothetical protein
MRPNPNTEFRSPKAIRGLNSGWIHDIAFGFWFSEFGLPSDFDYAH